ncbi:MAG: hypothetical protein SH847_11520 [Roseiflexaceae bacterium]|nr:hypothetical protein [Roseiflexaceae bacterium]
MRPNTGHTHIRPIRATGPTIRIDRSALLQIAPPQAVAPSWTWQQLLQWAGIPIVGLGYSIIFLIGIMQVIEYGGVPGLGIWGIGPIVVGALLAEEEWINGRLWIGLSGMVVWAGFPWLLALNLFPFAAIMCGAWCVTRFAIRRCSH